jgi:hypothetical protein
MEQTTIQNPDRVQCLNCKAVAGALAELQKRDIDGQVVAFYRQSLDFGTLETLRRANQCSTCTSLCAKFVQILNKSRGEVIEYDYQRKVSVGTVYGRFDLALVRTHLAVSISYC